MTALPNRPTMSIEDYREKNKLWTYHAFGAEEDMELASLGIHFPLSMIYRNMVFLEDGLD